MNDYNNNIDTFDAYLNGTMSETERTEFVARLKADSSLNEEFTAYQELVAGLQHAGEEADLEFEHALRNISHQDIKRIVERKPSEKKTSHQGRSVSLKKVYSWAAIAAVVAMVAGIGGYKYYQAQTRNKLCEAIFSAGFNPDMTLTRSVNQSVSEAYYDAVEKLKDGNTDAAISSLEKLYETADGEMKIECGTTLAYAYVKAHNLEKAWEFINKVKAMSQQIYGAVPDELESLIQAMEGQNLK